MDGDAHDIYMPPPPQPVVVVETDPPAPLTPADNGGWGNPLGESTCDAPGEPGAGGWGTAATGGGTGILHPVFVAGTLLLYPNTFSIYLTYQRAAAAIASRATPVRVQRSIILLSLSLPSPQLVEL